MPAQAVDPLVGKVVGEYRVTAKLGIGGAGVVYAGVHPEIGKRVAIKCLHWRTDQSPDATRRLIDEARAVNAVRHRGIIDIFGTGTLPDGRPYLLMELLEGESLDVYLERQPLGLPVEEVTRLLDAVCDALAAAHRTGVVHRDLKPSNVFLVRSPHEPPYPKLLDFGLAKLQANFSGDRGVSTTAGTPDFASPEQIRGRGLDWRSDVYSLGAMTFQLLTGRTPFDGGTIAEVLRKQLEAPPPRVSSLRAEVPASLDAVVLRMLQKAKEDRPSLAQIREALTLSRGAPAPAGGGAARARRRRWPAVLAGVALLGAALAVGAKVLRPPAVAVAPPPAPSPVEEEVRALRAQLAQGALLGERGAAVRLTRAVARHGEAPELAAVRGELVAALAPLGQAALGARQWDEAVALLSQASALAPQRAELAQQRAEAERGAFASQAGMVQVGSFWIDRYEWPNRKGALPATRVDWAEAKRSCESARKRLCTEAEWERACAGEGKRGWPYGARFDPGACQTGKRAVAPAGARAGCATAQGVADLSGNVAEWTESEIRPGAPQRVIRGGSHLQARADVSCAARDYFLPGQGGARHIGFRCCL